MYHDQGLIPKYTGMDRVNRWPALARTSPDHGTAFGRCARADPANLLTAVVMARALSAGLITWR